MNFVDQVPPWCEHGLPLTDSLHCEISVSQKLDLGSHAGIPADPDGVDAAFKKAFDNVSRYLKAGIQPSPSIARTLSRDNDDAVVYRWSGTERSDAPVPVLFWSDATGDSVVFATTERFVRSPELVRGFLADKLVWSVWQESIEVQFLRAPRSKLSDFSCLRPRRRSDTHTPGSSGSRCVLQRRDIWRRRLYRGPSDESGAPREVSTTGYPG